ncbi:MAG: winged helix-turn-helix domain-containing protein [Candidatus Dormibacteraceae bacterium]
MSRLALDLAWSLWSELGVPGGVRRHDWQALDLEPLILFTAWLGTDSRLRTSAMEWSIANARFASTFRLRHFAGRASPAMLAAFGRFAATVRTHTRAPWPGQGDPLTMLGHQDLSAPDLRRPSLIQLRLRALVGVSARAEILKNMIAEPDRPQSASALAEDAGYGKGSVAQALDGLTMAGIVLVQPAGNRLQYRLARPDGLAEALQWLPSTYPDWWPVFKIIEALSDYAHRTVPHRTGATTVENLVQRIDPELHRLGIADQIVPALGSAAMPEIEHWALNFLAGQAGRAPSAGGAPHEVSYRVHHLSFGGWLAATITAGREPAPIEVDGQTQLEEAGGAAKVAHAMFGHALDRSSKKRSDSPLIQVISREFSEEVLRPMRAGQEATFTAEFVRRWYENRQQRFGATA